MDLGIISMANDTIDAILLKLWVQFCVEQAALATVESSWYNNVETESENLTINVLQNNSKRHFTCWNNDANM